MRNPIVLFVFLLVSSIFISGCFNQDVAASDEPELGENMEIRCGISTYYSKIASRSCLESILESRNFPQLKKFIEAKHGQRALCEYPNVATKLSSAFPFKEVIEEPLKNCEFSKKELTDALAMSIMLKDNFEADLLVGIDLLCEMGADPNLVHPKYGTSPTMQVSSLDTLLLLERHGAKAGEIARDGQSLLHSAVDQDVPELVEYLIKTQPQLLQLKYRNETALDIAERGVSSRPTTERLKIAKLLEDSS